MTRYWPPLEAIRHSVLGRRLPMGRGAITPPDITPPEKEQLIADFVSSLPDLVRHAIDQHVTVCAARVSTFSRLPRAGQIVSIPCISVENEERWFEPPRPLAVLLRSHNVSADSWDGLIIAPQMETHFASDWDILLDTLRDGPYAENRVGVVQVWNPVRIHLPAEHHVQAELGPQRLAEIETRVAAFCADAPYSAGTMSVPRAGGKSQPSPETDETLRRAYQRIYLEAAEYVSIMPEEHAPEGFTQIMRARISRELERWAETLRHTIVPLAPILQPLGTSDAAPGSRYRLDDDLEITLFVQPKRRVLHVRLRNVGGNTIHAALVRESEVMKECRLGAGQAAEDLFADLRFAHDLRIHQEPTGRFYEIPLT